VQIGGGVRVSDAFQAIVEFEPIAIWVWKFCVKISQSEAFALRRKKERCETVEPASLRKAECASGVELKAGGVNGVAAEVVLGFRRRRSILSRFEVTTCRD